MFPIYLPYQSSNTVLTFFIRKQVSNKYSSENVSPAAMYFPSKQSMKVSSTFVFFLNRSRL